MENEKEVENFKEKYIQRYGNDHEFIGRVRNSNNWNECFENLTQGLECRVNVDNIDIESIEQTSDNALDEALKIESKGENKMIELSLDEQIMIRKKTYFECKHIKDDEIRKNWFKKIREVKQVHDNSQKFDDIEFDELISDARTAIRKWK